ALHATSYAEGAGPPAPTSAEVRINLDELNARIAGYDQALIDIEAALVANPRLTPDELSAVVTRLEQLAAQYSLVRLYYDALTADEQQRVGTLRDMGGAIDLVVRHAARQEAETDLLSDFDAASDQPTALERLRRLADSVRTAEPADR
ncbi:MAG TPA: hypothetical protein VEQ85_03810, partial [Lacipirellulaceae bacterium]|nr:hypothetical protein [Lacipirellulaceae bacterium]